MEENVFPPELAGGQPSQPNGPGHVHAAQVGKSLHTLHRLLLHLNMWTVHFVFSLQVVSRDLEYWE